MSEYDDLLEKEYKRHERKIKQLRDKQSEEKIKKHEERERKQSQCKHFNVISENYTRHHRMDYIDEYYDDVRYICQDCEKIVSPIVSGYR